MSVWVRCYLCIVLLYTLTKCQGEDCIQRIPHPKECIFQDHEGHKYNLTSIRNDNEKPRFRAPDKPKKPSRGYMYSFNPCVSFTLGSLGPASDCQTDVAVCQSHGREYNRRIGRQSSVKFFHYENTKIPMLHYCSDVEGVTWETAVLLKCDLNEEQGDFEVWTHKEAQNIKLNLTHKCACPDVCLLNPTSAPSDPSHPSDRTDSIMVPSIAGGGVLLIVVLIIIVWRVRKNNRNNNYPPLINDNEGGGAEVFVNQYPDTSEGSELTSGRNSASLTKLPSSDSSCSDITAPKKGQSFKSKGNMKSYVEENF